MAHEGQAIGTTITIGSGGEWKEGVQLAAKMGVSFPQVRRFSKQALLSQRADDIKSTR